MSQDTKTTGIRRYNIYAYVEYEYDYGEREAYAVYDTEPEEDGDWVKWEDVEKLINEGTISQ